MTKRQRVIREEESPISTEPFYLERVDGMGNKILVDRPILWEGKESEQIERAKERIKELQLLIKHWRKQ